MATRTHAECPLRLLTIVDEYTRECLGIEVARTLRADDVLHRLAQLIVQHGRPRYIRSDNNGPELRRMPFGNGSNSTLFIDPGSPWENGYN